MNALTFAVFALAVYRLTLLVTSDDITDRPRRWAIGRWTDRRHHATFRVRAIECSCGRTFRAAATTADPAIPDVLAAAYAQHLALVEADSFVGRLLDCPWCASVWLAFPAAWATLAWSDGWGWWTGAGALAASAVTGFLSHFATP